MRASSSTEPNRYTGTIKSLGQQWGFVDCDQYPGVDVFLGSNENPTLAAMGATAGSRVVFDLSESEKGLKAFNATPAGAIPAFGPISRVGAPVRQPPMMTTRPAIATKQSPGGKQTRVVGVVSTFKEGNFGFARTDQYPGADIFLGTKENPELNAIADGAEGTPVSFEVTVTQKGLHGNNARVLASGNRVGVLQSFAPTRFGFILCQDFPGENVFVHPRDNPELGEQPEVGRTVAFEIKESEKGLCALNAVYDESGVALTKTSEDYGLGRVNRPKVQNYEVAVDSSDWLVGSIKTFAPGKFGFVSCNKYPNQDILIGLKENPTLPDKMEAGTTVDFQVVNTHKGMSAINASIRSRERSRSPRR